jgi:NADPH2 dehydrogenase
MVRAFSPIAWGKLQLKNRIVMAPMCMYSADEHGFVLPFHFAHYTSRAYGGVAMVITEATSVEARGRISTQDLGIYDDRHVVGLKKLVDEVHVAGSFIAIQLAHAGRKCGVKTHTSIAPSAVTFSQDYTVPATMTIADIQEVIHAFREAARRAQLAGFDGIEIHGAHGYLINQFLSPLSNLRQDQYGGNLENRVRFLKEVLQSVRVVFKGEVWVRLSADEYADGGHHLQDTIALLQLIKPLIAGVNVSSGGVVPFPIKPSPGYQLPLSRGIQDAGIPTIGGGLITTMEAIEEALDKDATLVYLGRPLLLNPYFVLQEIKKHAPERMLKAYQRG